MKLAAKYWAGIVLLLLLVTWLGARKLNASGIWYDEWFSLYIAGADVFHVSRSLGDIWQRLSSEDVWQAPLYAYSLAAWGSAVGWTEFATRALSLLAGLVAVAGIFQLGWTIAKRPPVGLGAAALLGTSVWFIYFLHEMRVYMLMVMFTVLLLLFYRRVMYGQREPRLWHYLALGLITGLLINTHYFAVLAVGVLGLWHLAQLLLVHSNPHPQPLSISWQRGENANTKTRKKLVHQQHPAQLIEKRPMRRWWGVMGSWLLSGIMLAPAIINLQHILAPTNRQARVAADLSLLLHVTSDSLTAFSNTSVALLIVLLALSLFAGRARWLWLLGIPLLLLNLASYYLFGFVELRYNITVLPFLALLAGFGLDELGKRRVPAVLIVGVWAAGIITLDGNFQMDRIIQHWPGQPIREMAQALRPLVAPEDAIVNVVGDEDRSTLAAHSLVYYMGDFGAHIDVVENNLQPNVRAYAARLQKAAGEATRVWLLRDPRWVNSVWGLSEYALNQQNLYRCATVVYTPQMQIWGFGRVNPADKAWQMGDGIRLSTIGQPHVKDGLLQVWFGYQIDAKVPANTYSVGAYLLDVSGQVRAQFDGGLPATGTSCQAADMSVANLPAGDYQLRAAVYNWQTGERLQGTAPDGSASDLQNLGSVTLPSS
jgi:hypothetical protein